MKKFILFLIFTFGNEVKPWLVINLSDKPVEVLGENWGSKIRQYILSSLTINVLPNTTTLISEGNIKVGSGKFVKGEKSDIYKLAIIDNTGQLITDEKRLKELIKSFFEKSPNLKVNDEKGKSFMDYKKENKILKEAYDEYLKELENKLAEALPTH